MFQVSERWMTAYPDAMVAVLVVKGATNAQEHPALEARKRSLEADLRSRFADPDAIKSAEAIAPYVAYYRRFEKTYHLMQQLKTVVVKGRPMPTVSGLVDVMFMAEMRNLLLTAGHDLATVELPITLDVCTGEERYVKLNGVEQLAKAGDMMVVDRRGVLSSVIHGPDFRSRIAPQTRDVLYVVYAPSGITRDSAVRHVADMADSILLFSPSAQADPVRILSARGVEQIGL